MLPGGAPSVALFHADVAGLNEAQIREVKDALSILMQHLAATIVA
jgi:hypothetical protein